MTKRKNKQSNKPKSSNATNKKKPLEKDVAAAPDVQDSPTNQNHQEKFSPPPTKMGTREYDSEYWAAITSVAPRHPVLEATPENFDPEWFRTYDFSQTYPPEWQSNLVPLPNLTRKLVILSMELLCLTALVLSLVFQLQFFLVILGAFWVIMLRLSNFHEAEWLEMAQREIERTGLKTTSIVFTDNEKKRLWTMFVVAGVSIGLIILFGDVDYFNDIDGLLKKWVGKKDI
ncbi:hypothetical protein QBC38DRAFT_439208 [Podospora fimiseda]|uniref:Uncharacterized protein n=1 Tax=Podospora fimiseda TaxID=252190 RepID=A0AAN7BZ22_9PEZI|nr:hypothetical protein QBC38DRAFT_439208 [Podospora fimiseda]